MRIKIAEVRLAPGQVGFYDELTNIHLTLTKPLGIVYQGMNTSRLQKSINSKRLVLVWGSLKPVPISLSEEPAVVDILHTEKKVSTEKKKKTKKAEPKLEQEVISEEPAQLFDVEPIKEEVVADEEVVKVSSSKKKTAKKKETVSEEE